MPNNVYLDSEGRTSDRHGDSDNWKVDARKFETPYVDVFPAENVPPQETSQRRAERSAERTIVDAERHGIYCSPVRPVGDWKPVISMDLLPCLNDAADKDGSTNIRT